MGDFNAKHSSWGCDVDTRRGITFNNHIQRSGYRILAPPTPTRASRVVPDFSGPISFLEELIEIPANVKSVVMF
ncbi:hypothetical protein TNCV_3531941 [Trichonephila clavipes]|nr:hypothetical protein TNCV_3531941 [Trichonephila clavipes]